LSRNIYERKAMGRKFKVTYKPTGRVYEFDTDNPPEDTLAMVYFILALNNHDMVLKAPYVELILRIDDLEIEELDS